MPGLLGHSCVCAGEGRGVAAATQLSFIFYTVRFHKSLSTQMSGVPFEICPLETRN